MTSDEFFQNFFRINNNTNTSLNNKSFYIIKHHLLSCEIIPFTMQNATFYHVKRYLLQHKMPPFTMQNHTFYNTLALLRIQISLNGFHILISLHGIYCRDVPQVCVQIIYNDNTVIMGFGRTWGVPTS